jgi:uncharacterized membrane protein (UPF0127 family)
MMALAGTAVAKYSILKTMKKLMAIIILFLIAISIAWFAWPRNTTLAIGTARLHVTIADSPDEIVQGLSGRPSMQENEGMLFVFPAPLVPKFWMKEMHFALDIIWIDESKRIVGIEKNISPDTYPATFQPAVPVKYVLEVNAGWTDAHSIAVQNLVDIKY